MLFAVAENYRGDDPTAGVTTMKPAVRSKGHMTWGAEQIARPSRSVTRWDDCAAGY